MARSVRDGRALIGARRNERLARDPVRVKFIFNKPQCNEREHVPPMSDTSPTNLPSSHASRITPRILSGMQPTHDSLHLGNYLGALK